jgi:hypothetical protein
MGGESLASLVCRAHLARFIKVLPGAVQLWWLRRSGTGHTDSYTMPSSALEVLGSALGSLQLVSPMKPLSWRRLVVRQTMAMAAQIDTTLSCGWLALAMAES